MSNYQDQWSRYHDKPTDGINPSSGNGFLYTAYAVKLGLPISPTQLKWCWELCSIGGVLRRNPEGQTSPFSRDECLGAAYLGLLKPNQLKGWNFSPYPLPKLQVLRLLRQLNMLWTIKPATETGSWYKLFGPIYVRHRNYFWKNGLSQIYRVSFSVPLQDRAFLLECWGETKSLRYFFYKAIAKLDATFSKPKNGIHWLKYGGEERKRIMQQEFPSGHPLRY